MLSEDVICLIKSYLTCPQNHFNELRQYYIIKNPTIIKVLKCELCINSLYKYKIGIKEFEKYISSS